MNNILIAIEPLLFTGCVPTPYLMVFSVMHLRQQGLKVHGLKLNECIVNYSARVFC